MPRFTFAQPDGQMSVIHWSKASPDGARPVLHWAHANGFNGQTYDKLLAPLSDQFDIFAADARGHGHTDLPADPPQMTGWHIYANDLERLVAHLADAAGQKIWLGGHSMGGCTSILLAAKRPDLVAGLVLADPVIVPNMARWMMPIIRRLRPNQGGLQLAAMAAKRRAVWPDQATITEAYRGRGAFKTWRDGFLEDYLAGGLRAANGEATPGAVRLACDPQWEAVNFKGPQINNTGPIKKLRVPFTLLMAQYGSTTRAPRAFAVPAVDGKIEVVAGSTHFLPMEQPEKVQSEIIARLNG